MQRRTFLGTLLRLTGLASLPPLAAMPAAAAPVAASPAKRRSVSPALLLQVSPLAGFQYHQGAARWPELREGAALSLTREADNPFDERAIRVDWRGCKLGYVPRAENTTLASLMDRGHTLEARIRALRQSHDPWERVEMEILLAMDGEAMPA